MYPFIYEAGRHFKDNTDKSIISREISHLQRRIFENDLFLAPLFFVCRLAHGRFAGKSRYFFPSLFRLLPTVYFAI